MAIFVSQTNIDKYLAVPFPKTGLSDEDLENFRRHGIDLSY